MTLEALFEGAALVLTIVGWAFAGIVAHGRARKNEIEKLNNKIDALGEAPSGMRGMPARLDKLEGAHAEFRLHVAEHYISRDDWVPTVSRVIGMLEGHTRMLVRLDERTRAQGAARKEGIDER